MTMTNNRRSLLSGAAFMLMAGFGAAIMPVVATQPAQAQADQGAKAAADFVQSLGDKAIATLADSKVSKEQTKEIFRQLLNDNFDVATIGRFVLGRYWNTATEPQRKEYMDLFERMIVEVYAERFSQYAGESFKVSGAQPAGQRDAVVVSQVLRPNGPPVNVAWRVRAKDGGYKIVDVVVENVSMSQTQRSEFASVIENNGGKFDALLEALRQRISHPATATP
ncbi:ABC transporter substrate-binding protein [Niveispirillum sp. SYP-B3756]|uniref:MlaC/ttg2D family ABC transporter substrate-binding protein n=1 Tax=Niveispirillum sp. SYP-B3756 TaxID=2662178 RepID=UPI001FFEF0F6|nr:ABC transporter substrate-binding protein [Niveispirillum sp. SYP-B3756]